jgi:hypothetical protein
MTRPIKFSQSWACAKRFSCHGRKPGRLVSALQNQNKAQKLFATGIRSHYGLCRVPTTRTRLCGSSPSLVPICISTNHGLAREGSAAARDRIATRRIGRTELCGRQLTSPSPELLGMQKTRCSRRGPSTNQSAGRAPDVCQAGIQ